MLSSNYRKYRLVTVAREEHNIKRKLLHAGGWQVVKRAAQAVPFGGTAVAVVLVGSDIKNKGVMKGIANSCIDAIPVVGLVKNGVELFTGDFIADKPKRVRRIKGNGK